MQHLPPLAAMRSCHLPGAEAERKSELAWGRDACLAGAVDPGDPGGTEPLPKRKTKAGSGHWGKNAQACLPAPSISCQCLPLAMPVARREPGGQRVGAGEGAQNKQRKGENRPGCHVAPGRECCPISQMRKLMPSAPGK